MKKLLLGMLMVLSINNLFGGCGPVATIYNYPSVGAEQVDVNTKLRFMTEFNDKGLPNHNGWGESITVMEGHIRIYSKEDSVLVDSININDFYPKYTEVGIDTFTFDLNKPLDSFTTYYVTIDSYSLTAYKWCVDSRPSIGAIASKEMGYSTNWFSNEINGIPGKWNSYSWEFTTVSFNASLDTTSTTCNGLCDGEVIVTVPNDVQFTINGVNGLYYNTLCADTYDIEMVSDWGCKVNRSFIINEPKELTNSKLIFVDSIPNTDSITTEISIFTSGGVGGYQYSWSYDNNYLVNNSNVLNTEVGGWYDITISDNNNCQLLDSVLVDYQTTVNSSSKVTMTSLGIKSVNNTILLPTDMLYATYDISGRLLQKGFGRKIYQNELIFFLRVNNNVIKILNN